MEVTKDCGKLVVSEDCIIRGAKVKAAVQNMKPIIILRSLHKLLPLQLKENDIKLPSNRFLQRSILQKFRNVQR